MRVTVVTRPDPIVNLEEAKAHLREDSEDGDAYIESLVQAASEWIDGSNGWLGRSIGRQTLELRCDSFHAIRLVYPPFIEVQEIAYTDPGGAEQIVDPGSYQLVGQSVVLRSGSSWPDTFDDPEAVRITYVAGYDEPPAPIKQAVLLLVGQWYRSREAVIVGAAATEMPLGVKNLLAPFRLWL